jgi:cytoskeletal protein CcmA (bactofilin family)
MFQKKSQPAPPALSARLPTEPARSGGVPSILSAGMVFRGDMTGTGDVQIDGSVFGKVEVGHLVIAEGGTVEGEIVARAVRISGTLHGTVRAETVSLTATARVQGDVWHDVLEIEAGAQLEGQCKRIANHPAAGTLLSAPETVAALPNAS